MPDGEADVGRIAVAVSKIDAAESIRMDVRIELHLESHLRSAARRNRNSGWRLRYPNSMINPD